MAIQIKIGLQKNTSTVHIDTNIQQHGQTFYLTNVAIHLPLAQLACFNVQLT